MSWKCWWRGRCGEGRGGRRSRVEEKMEGMVAAAAAGVAAEGGVDDQLEGEEGREGSQEEECGEKVEEPVAEGGLGWLAVALQFRWVQTAWSEELLDG